MCNSDSKNKNFSKLDSLVFHLDDMLQHVPEMNNMYSRRLFSVHARVDLHKVWNLAHGTDLDDFCADDEKPTPLDGAC